MKLLEWLDELLFPRRTLCLCCGRVSHGADVCPACQSELENSQLTGDLCPLCGHALTHSPCAFCKGDVPGRMTAVWPHQGAARRLVHQLKYNCVADAARVMALPMAKRVRMLEIAPDTVVTWVTMPEGRRRERGIDHGRVLAEAVAKELGLPCRRLLVRRKRVRNQRGLSRRARQRNLEGVFDCPEMLTGAVLLVDDVMTTSATARVCAKALKDAGAAEIWIVTATQA